MCAPICLDHRLIYSVGELKEALGQDPVFEQGIVHTPMEDECVCNVDLDATAALIGRVTSWCDGCSEWSFAAQQAKEE